MRLCTALAALLLTLPADAAEWLRFRTAHIELLTDAGEKTGRQTLARLEQIGEVFPKTEPNHYGAPLRVFLFASAGEFGRFVDSDSTAGLYQQSGGDDSIILRAGAALPRSAVHEYIHFVLDHGPALLPNWFEEGTAEFYSNIEVRRRGLLVGAAIPEHLATLSAKPWLDARDLASQPPGDGVYYAQCWALVHMLNLAPGYRESMPRFAELLTEGRDPEAAFREAFGRDLDRALADLHGYLGNLHSVTLGEPPPTPAPADPPERLSAAQALVLRAGLALRRNRMELARRLLDQAERASPGSAAVEAGLGRLAAAQRKPEEARRRLERAVSLDDRDADACFQYALSEREAGASPDRVRELLEKAAALDPNLGDAQLLLGLRATDDGQYEEAVVRLEQAARTMPRRSDVWHALAYVQQKLGRNDAAIESAGRAVRTASNQEQAEMAQTLLSSIIVGH
jgi:tetratricopeptide (TPR) repeat protein